MIEKIVKLVEQKRKNIPSKIANLIEQSAKSVETPYIYDKIFTSNEAAIQLLEELYVFRPLSLCYQCNGLTKVRKSDKGRPNGWVYFCVVCKLKKSLTDETFLKDIKLELKILLHVIYGFIANFEYFQIELLTNITYKTYTKIKR